MLAFLKKYKWLNFFVAVIGSAGTVFLVDAARWKFFVDNPSMLVALGTIVGLFTRFYKANQAEIDGEILATGDNVVVIKTSEPVVGPTSIDINPPMPAEPVSLGE